MILDAAIEFFAERGFAAQTRDLATSLDISESLIYRYFPSKDELVRSAFREVIDSRWDPGWIDLLRDRDLPLRERLLQFYNAYLDAIDDPIWVRIVMYASLDGLDLTRHYIAARVDDVLETIAKEAAASSRRRRPIDSEVVWHLHSTLIYFLVRKHIHAVPVADDRSSVVAMAVDSLVDGLPARNGSGRDRG
jgi:AcrR family transcriptional regulator